MIFNRNTVVNFTQNLAMHNGGAIFLTNHSSLLFEKGSLLHDKNDHNIIKEVFIFKQNKANSFGNDIYAYDSNLTFGDNATVTFDGDAVHSDSMAVYIEHHSNITFEGNSKVTLKATNTVMVELCASIVSQKLHLKKPLQ